MEVLIIAAEKRWIGSVSEEEKALRSVSVRSEMRAAQSNSVNSKLLDEVARLNAENSLLKIQLEKFKAMDEAIKLTGLVHL